MSAPMIITPSQTVGPYFRIGLGGESWVSRLPATEAHPVEIRGAVYDADARPILDALLELWQPDRKHFARAETDPALGTYRVQAPRPSSLVDPQGLTHAPHITVGVFARGLLKRLHTRIYFADEPLNARDPVLALVPAERRTTLIATATDAAKTQFTFDIRLSGDGETVFFEC